MVDESVAFAEAKVAELQAGIASTQAAQERQDQEARDKGLGSAFFGRFSQTLFIQQSKLRAAEQALTQARSGGVSRAEVSRFITQTGEATETRLTTSAKARRQQEISKRQQIQQPTTQEPTKRFQGPVRPGRDVETFRTTGKSVPVQRFQGPVRPTTDIQTFRTTGRVTPATISLPGSTSDVSRVVGKDISTGKEFSFAEYSKSQFVSEYNMNLQRYKDAGYSDKEARALAKYSSSTQSSPTKDIVKPYLYSQGVIPAFSKEPLTNIYMNVDKTTKKALGEFGYQFVTGGSKEPKQIYEEQKDLGSKGTSPIITSIYGGLELSKYIVFKPFSFLQKDILKPSASYVTGKNVWLGAPLEIAADLSPTTPAKALTFYGIGKAFKYAPKITKLTFTGAGAYGLTEAETPKEYVESGLMFGIGSGKTIVKSLSSAKALMSSQKAVKIPFVEIPETPLRPRATVILKHKDLYGRTQILYSADKPTGTYMLPGGAINKGELPKVGALRELAEETGLKNIKLNFKEIIKTSEQKHYVFEAFVDKNVINAALKAQKSEITGFKWLHPPKYTGPSMLQPFGRKINIWDKKIVRAEDLFVGAKSIYPNLKQTRLVIQSPGEVFLRGGKSIFLKKRVGDYDISRLWGKKPGQFKKFQKLPGIVVGFGSRYDIPYAKLKKYSGKELLFVHGSPGKIQTQILTESLGGKPKGFGNLNTKEFFNIESKYFKRGEKVFFFQPPTTGNLLTSQGYLGATYLGLYKKARKDYSMGVKLKYPSPSIYTYQATLGKDLFATKKAMRGSEFEVGKRPIVKQDDISFIIGAEGKTYLAGKKVNIIELKKSTKTPTEKQIKSIAEKNKEVELLKYYEQTGRRPVSPGELLSDISSPVLVKGKSPIKYSYKSPITKSIIVKYPTKEIYKEKPTTTKYKYTPYKEKTTPYKYKYVPYKEPSVTYSYKEPPYKEPPTPYKYKSPTTGIGSPFFRKRSTKSITSGMKIPVYLRRFGKFRIVGFGRTTGQAIGIGRKFAMEGLGRTFKIGGVKVPKSLPGFRTKKTKKGILFIEKTKTALSQAGEQAEIQMARALKGGKI